MKTFPRKIIQVCIISGMFAVAEGQIKVRTTVVKESVLQIMSEFFSNVSIADGGLELRWKKQEAMTSCRIDGKKLENMDQPAEGVIVHLGKNQRFSITQGNGPCRIHISDGPGFSGIAVSRNDRISNTEKIEKKAASKIDWTNKKWMETNEIEERRMLELAGFIEIQPLIPQGVVYKRAALDDLIQDVFKTVSAGENGLELRLKDEVNRHRISIDDQVRFAEPGEIIRIAPGQKWKLLGRHGSLSILVVKDKDMIKIVAVRILHDPYTKSEFEISTGRVDAPNGRFAPLGEAESEELMKSTGILGNLQKDDGNSAK